MHDNSLLYTKSLVFIAVQAIIISSLFTIYKVHLPTDTAKHWLVKKLTKCYFVKESVNYLKNKFGYDDIKSTIRKNKESANKKDAQLVLTSEQLALFDGSRQSKPVYLALLGRIYNVEKGRKHYAAGGGYNFFAGKDATRAFVTGDFTATGLMDDVAGLSENDLLSINDWILFYDKEYEFVGVLEGTYYDARGKPTVRLREVNKEISRAKTWKEKQLKESEVFPPCNSEWKKEIGGRVWCTTKSGGVIREWVGVPRKLYTPGTKNFRCACVKNFGHASTATDASNSNRGDLDHPNLKEYAGCSHTSISCRLPAE